MKIAVDPELCICCGLCPCIAPSYFEMGTDNLAMVVKENVNEDDISEVMEAIQSCPTDAIEEI